MFPFWDVAIKPVLQAAAARRVVEIGALRGETTELVLDALGPDCEFHVIDPSPDFDPSALEARFGARYQFHRDLSHAVLPALPAVDVALIDGDHNWYTVYHELKMLAETAEAAGRDLPVLVMHDVCWPYGRRDLYYAADRIPEDFRQPHRRAGMRQGRSSLVEYGGGLNRHMDNACEEGSERNGVRTALDDFIAEHPHPVRSIVLPVYFGLAIVAEERTLDRLPDVAAAFDHIEGPASVQPLLQLAEDLRLESAVAHHDLIARDEGRRAVPAQRYINLLKGTLTNEVAIDQEVRLQHAMRCLTTGDEVVPAQLCDPVLHSHHSYRARLEARRSGFTGPDTAPLFVRASSGRARLDALHDALDDIRSDRVAGDLIDIGVRRGGSSIFMRGFLDAWAMKDRMVWVADRFTSQIPAADDDLESALSQARPDITDVREGFERFDLMDKQVKFLHGDPATMASSAPISTLALVRMDATIAGGIGPCLDALYDRVADGGVVQIDHLEEADETEVLAYRDKHGISEPLQHPAPGLAMWVKARPATDDDEAPAGQEAAPVEIPKGAALIGEAPRDTCHLTVVVVFYNMAREAQRTLHSLSRAYQLDTDDIDYEVIAVDNGSEPGQRLTAEGVASFGDEFRLISLTGDDAHPSPVRALNVGLSQARGRNVAVMIDGAHMLSPRVLHYGMIGLRSWRPAVVATQPWYLGPGQQHDAMNSGYDQATEDALLEQVGWPHDGYRLFDIAHFIGDRDWFDPLWESNCLFIPRTILTKIGAFDESFDMPGGGYANLDIFERVTRTPGCRTVALIGEGSFHQVHGGTTTNHVDNIARHQRIRDYKEHFEQLRGRPYRASPAPYCYIGALQDRSKRTRGRRRGGAAFREPRGIGPDSRPADASQIPTELADEFTAAFWQSKAWQKTKWMGRGTRTTPADLVIVQELIASVRPDWVIQLGGVAGGGLAQFLAHVCELKGRGQVLAIDEKAADTAPEHPRLHILRLPPPEPETFDEIRSRVPEGATGLVLFGLDKRNRLMGLFDQYEQFVSEGSYAVFLDSIVNGNPVWPAFGPGPTEAVTRLLQQYHDFVLDPISDKFGLSFSRRGVLRRVAGGARPEQ